MARPQNHSPLASPAINPAPERSGHQIAPTGSRSSKTMRLNLIPSSTILLAFRVFLLPSEPPAASD